MVKYFVARIKEYSTWTMLALAAVVAGFVPDPDLKWVVFGFLFCGAWVADGAAKSFWAQVQNRIWGEGRDAGRP